MLARVKKLTVAMTKTQLFSDIAENTALTRRQVADVFEALESVIERHVRKGAVGVCITAADPTTLQNVSTPAAASEKSSTNAWVREQPARSSFSMSSTLAARAWSTR